jgi:hypothetical protein
MDAVVQGVAIGQRPHRVSVELLEAQSGLLQSGTGRDHVLPNQFRRRFSLLQVVEGSSRLCQGFDLLSGQLPRYLGSLFAELNVRFIPVRTELEGFRTMVQGYRGGTFKQALYLQLNHTL